MFCSTAPLLRALVRSALCSPSQAAAPLLLPIHDVLCSLCRPELPARIPLAELPSPASLAVLVQAPDAAPDWLPARAPYSLPSGSSSCAPGLCVLPAPRPQLPCSSSSADWLARLCVTCVAFRYSCACCREAPYSVLLRRVVVRAKLLALDIESVTHALDTVKRCVCLCPSPPDRDLALLLASLLAKSFPCPRHKIRSATVSSNCEASSPCALASAAADSAIKFTSASCSICFAVGNFSTFPIPCCLPRVRSLLIHRVSRVLAFTVESSNPSSLA
jgi:hypothetical protein